MSILILPPNIQLTSIFHIVIWCMFSNYGMCLYVYAILTHCISNDMNNVDIRINMVSIEYSTLHIHHLLCTLLIIWSV